MPRTRPTRTVPPAPRQATRRRRATPIAAEVRGPVVAASADLAAPGSRLDDGPRVAPAPQPPLVVATADPSLMRMLAFALDQHHLPFVPYTSGSAVLDALLSLPKGGPPAVVLLDVDLPGVDGHAILERLGVERPDSFLLVVLSSHADESTQVRSLLAGALDHLAKPFNVRVLMAKLRRWTAIARRCEAA